MNRNKDMVIITSNVNYEDVVLFENKFDFGRDPIKAGYNIGDLLNIPFLNDAWKQNPLHHSDQHLQRMNLVAEICPGSILHHYVSSRPVDEAVPSIDRIRLATDEYISHNMYILSKLISFVENPFTLTVHVRCGDKIVCSEFISSIQTLSLQFRRVVILSGVHMDERFQDNHVKITRFCSTMNLLLRRKKFSLIMDTPDNHLCLMKHASHLLLHIGGFSALGSIVATGHVYTTPLFSFQTKRNWNAIVGTRIDIV